MTSRYNIFYQVHKGLRALLYETSLCLQQTDFREAGDADQVLDQVYMATNLFTTHAQTEEQYIMTAIRNYSSLLYDECEKEYAGNVSLTAHMHGLIQAYYHAVTGDEKQEIGSVIISSFRNFTIFNLELMGRKENSLNKALWKNYTDEELMDITLQISKDLSPETSAQYSKWILRGVSNGEVIEWLMGIKQTAPDRIFNALLEMAENEIRTERWNKIQESLAEGAMLA